MAAPSALTYRDRVSIRKDDTYVYNRLYLESQTGSVFDRLSRDAGSRQSRRGTYKTYNEGENVFYSTGNLSGFVSNTSRPPTTGSMAPGFMEAPPLDDLNPISLMSYKKGYPIEYMSTIRPNTSTMNQTLRMMGTYGSDQEWASKTSVFIPSGCPAGNGKFFHPDVKPRT